MRPATALIAVLVLFASGGAAAQSLPTALESLRAASDKLGSTHPDKVAMLNTQIGRLESGAASIPPAQRADYAKSLAAQADVLAAIGKEPDGSVSAAQIDDVAADLALKARARRLGAANTLVGLIKVSARTRRGAQQISGLAVGASPVALAGGMDPMFVFPTLSSPTSRDLPPGRYEFMVKQDNVVVARQRADIGLTSTEAITLDLVVPPAPGR